MRSPYKLRQTTPALYTGEAAMNLYGGNHKEAYQRGRVDIQEAIKTGELPPGASRRLVGGSYSISFLVALLIFLMLLLGMHWHIFPALGVGIAVWFFGGIFYALAQALGIRVLYRARMRRSNISN